MGKKRTPTKHATSTAKPTTEPTAPSANSTDVLSESPRAIPYAWVWLLGIVALTFLVYAGSLKNGFTNWDDTEYVTKNPYLALTSENLPHLLTGTFVGNKHPLTMLSLSVDHQFGGKTDGFPYHLTSLLWHLLNTVLVFFFIRQLANGRTAVALITAAAFALHPMHVESVSWVSARKDVLYTAFFLAGLIAYVRYVDRRTVGWLVLAFALATLSMLAKPAAVVFGVVLLLIDWYRQRPLGEAKVWLEKVPFLALGFLTGWLTINAQGEAIDRETYTIVERLVYGAYDYIAYLVKAVYWGKLSAFHAYPLQEHRLTSMYYACVPLALGLLGFAWWRRRQAPSAFWGLAFYTVTIALVLQVITIGSALLAERYTYVPYIGLFFAIGMGFERLQGVARTGALALLVAFGAAAAFQTWQQSMVWKDSITLFSQAIENYPQTRNAYLNRAGAYMDTKQYDRALQDLNKADFLKPNHIMTRSNRGLCLYEMGRYQDAMKDFDWLASGNVGKAIDYVRRGDCLSRMGRPEEALKAYENALAKDANEGKAYNNRAMIYFNQKNYDQAISDYTKALELASKPDGQVLKNRGATYLLKGDYAAAIQDFDQSVAAGHNEGDLYYYRSAAHQKLGQMEAAKADALKAKELNYALPAGYLGL